MKPLSSSDPRVVGSWVLVGRLGSGDMGVVYLWEPLSGIEPETFALRGHKRYR
jgi:hypothetical protein